MDTSPNDLKLLAMGFTEEEFRNIKADAAASVRRAVRRVEARKLAEDFSPQNNSFVAAATAPTYDEIQQELNDLKAELAKEREKTAQFANIMAAILISVATGDMTQMRQPIDGTNAIR